MKKNPGLARRIKKLREAHYPSQKALADALHVRQTVVSAWETGDNQPSSPAWVKLGNLADYPESVWFWQQAGIGEQDIARAGENILKGRCAPPVAGEVIRVPRFRETLHGRESAGPPVPLPSEFISNPLSTVCLIVDREATAVLDSPHAVFILDETHRDAADLAPFWGNVVFASYDAEAGTNPRWKSGIYAGRLVFFNNWPRGRDDTYSANAYLYLLTGLEPKRPMEVGWKAYPELRGSGDIGVGVPPRGQNPQVDAARDATRIRAASELRLSFGWHVLGRVIGRLSMADVQNVAKFVDV